MDIKTPAKLYGGVIGGFWISKNIIGKLDEVMPGEFLGKTPSFIAKVAIALGIPALYALGRLPRGDLGDVLLAFGAGVATETIFDPPARPVYRRVESTPSKTVTTSVATVTSY